MPQDRTMTFLGRCIIRLFDLGVVPRHPADLILQQNGVPAIRRGGDVAKHGAILHSRDAAEGCAVALADVHRAAGADDDNLGRNRGVRVGRLSDGLHRLGDGLIRRGGLSGLASVIVGHSAHQRLVGLVAVDAILLDADLLLESLHSGLGFAAEVAVHFQGGRDDGRLSSRSCA